MNVKKQKILENIENIYNILNTIYKTLSLLLTRNNSSDKSGNTKAKATAISLEMLKTI